MSSCCHPVEKAVIDCVDFGKTTKVPALDKRWVTVVDEPLPKYIQLTKYDAKAKHEWLENIQEQVNLCEWLLSLEYHQFWSQVMYDTAGLAEMLETYIENCPRYLYQHQMKATFFSTNPKISNSQQRLHKLVFLVYTRLAKSKESDELFMEPDFHAKQLQNWFDVSVLIDLCSAFGFDNKKIVSGLVESLLQKRPKFLEEIRAVCKALIQRLEDVQTQLKTFLRRKAAQFDVVSQEMALEYRDIVLYLADFVFSIGCFLDCLPAARRTFHDAGFTMQLPAYFESILCVLADELFYVSRGGFHEMARENMEGRLCFAANEWIRIFRCLLEYNCINPLINTVDSWKEAGDCLGDYYEIMTNVLSDKKFLAMIESKYPFEADCASFMENGAPIDHDQLSYLRSNISETLSVFTQIQKTNKNPVESLAPSQKQIVSTNGWYEGSSQSENVVLGSIRKTAPAERNAEETRSKISGIKDMFPEMSDTHIENCLKYYDYDAERVVDAILNGNLPPDFAHAAAENQATSSSDFAAVAASSFNSDKDVGPEGESLIRLTTGKKRGVTRDTLFDKADLVELKPFYRRHQFETPDSNEESDYGSDGELKMKREFKVRPLNEAISVYDDEYDDTYDTHNVGAQDADSADEMTTSLQKTPTTVQDDTGSGNSKGSTLRPNESTHNERHQNRRNVPMQRRHEEAVTSAYADNDAKSGYRDARNRGNNDRYDTHSMRGKNRQQQNYNATEGVQPEDADQNSFDARNMPKDGGLGPQRGGRGGASTGYTGGHDRAFQDRHRQQTKHHNRRAGADRKLARGY